MPANRLDACSTNTSNVSALYRTLTLAAAIVLAACGGGGGGSTGAPPAPAPVAPKALDILSAAVQDGDRDVDVAQPVDPRVTFRFAFNTNLGASAIGAGQVQLSDGTRTYPVSLVATGSTLTVTPIGNLHTGLNYTLTVKAGATSPDGSVLKSDKIVSFRTVAAVFESKQLAQGDRFVGSGPDTRIVITDINGDGRPDAVKLGKRSAADRRDNAYTLSVFVQNNAGGFDRSQKLEYIFAQQNYQARFNGLIVQDIDGDKKPELLVPELPSDFDEIAVAGIRIYKADAAGNYAARDFIETRYVQSLQAMDVDGDGLTDLVGHRGETSFDRTSAFQILRKTSGGYLLLSPVVLPSGDYEFGVADIDMDGKRELIVNRIYYTDGPTKSQLLMFSQSAPATFSFNAALTSEALGFCSVLDPCKTMKVVDMNGDGKPELAFSGSRFAVADSVNAVLAFSRLAGGGWAKASQTTLDYGNFYGQVYAIEDMDGDAIPDVLALAAGDFGILRGGSNFGWEFSNKIKLPVVDTMYPSNVAIADMDGDGLPDIVFDSVNSGIVVARQVNFRRRP